MVDDNSQIREKFHNLFTVEETAEDWEPMICIGTAAKKVGLSVAAIRKYEKEGLLKFHRTKSNRRLLARADISRIVVIQRLINDHGLNMEGIRRLLALLPCWELKPCSEEMKNNCVAVNDYIHPCWMVENNECSLKGEICRDCSIYRYSAYYTETMKQLLHNLDDRK